MKWVKAQVEKIKSEILHNKTIDPKEILDAPDFAMKFAQKYETPAISDPRFSEGMPDY